MISLKNNDENKKMNFIKIKNLGGVDINELYKKVKSENADKIGCIVSFCGIVRENTRGRITKELHRGMDEDAENIHGYGTGADYS
ncbi:MAG: hypothetical protein A7315_01200 [Candidatus Altiarchaeales archaeon WOR_SM1_79]|nr:MAG: hypothetical protein A7315_01200 [Candidatus Altiarchaeales archaeon WOR_SM1_79]